MSDTERTALGAADAALAPVGRDTAAVRARMMGTAAEVQRVFDEFDPDAQIYTTEDMDAWTEAGAEAAVALQAYGVLLMTYVALRRAKLNGWAAAKDHATRPATAGV